MRSGSLVQVQRVRQGAQGWCTGMTVGDGMGREVGGGFWMENTCAPVADSWQKPLQYCKVISLQLKNKNKNKNKFIALHVPFCSPHSSTYVTNKSPFSHISLKETEKVI